MGNAQDVAFPRGEIGRKPGSWLTPSCLRPEANSWRGLGAVIPSNRARNDEDLGAMVRASFISSYRTYGARRVWYNLLAEGLSCGLHCIKRLMRVHGLFATFLP